MRFAAFALPVSTSFPPCLAIAFVLFAGGCQKSDKVQTTAERLKNVEVRQQTEPDAYLPRKNVDYMATMKDLKDVPQKPEPRQEVKAAVAPPPAAAPAPPVVAPSIVKGPDVVKPVPVETRPAAPVVAPIVNEAPKKVEAPKVDAASAQSESTYFASLRAYLNSVKRYPTSREARSQRPAGTVQVSLEIARDGKLRDASVEKTSESILLDQAALATIRQGSYSPFPADAWPGQGSRRFSIGLEYSLSAQN